MTNATGDRTGSSRGIVCVALGSALAAAFAGVLLVVGMALADEVRPVLLLSSGSDVEFRPSVWREYRWHIAVAIAFAGAQMVLIVGLLMGRQQRRRVQQRLHERRRFAVLLADLAAAFVEIPAQEIDKRIAEALQRTMDELGLDRAALAEFVPGAGEVRLAHRASREGIAPPPARVAVDQCPWTFERLGAGEEVRIARLTDLPVEAARDRESFAAAGTQAIVILPLRVEGTLVGSLTCSMERERDWSRRLIHDLRALADLFAVVLMRQRAGRVLAASEQRFHQLADTSPVMMWIAGPDGHCIDVNRAWLAFTGRALDDQLGDGWLEAVHPDDRASCVARYTAALAARQPFTMEYRLRRADGVYRAVLDNGTPSFDADHVFQGYVGSTVDVTEVKRAQQSLVESLALRSAIFGSLYGQVAAVDDAGVIIAVNEGWTQALEQQGGDPRTAGVGVNYFDVCRRAAAAGDAHARAAVDAIEQVSARQTERALIEYPCATSTDTRWYAMVVEPFRRPEGGLVISHINITRRRLAEEEVQREREELAHALRVATLGGLATSLAHEINQPLATIASNAHAALRLVDSPPADAEVPAALHDIVDAAQRAAQIIRRMRVLFRRQPSEPHPVDLALVIKEVIELLHRDLEQRRVGVDLTIAPALPRVLGDVVQLQQVLLNVVVNAAEAMAGAGDPRQLGIDARVREPATVAITISDTGTGVAESELEHIFERFVTSKPDGLGMGLSISRSIITAHGGRIWATRNVESGLTVHIEVPALEG